jgi:hypothetical protein
VRIMAGAQQRRGPHLSLGPVLGGQLGLKGRGVEGARSLVGKGTEATNPGRRPQPEGGRPPPPLPWVPVEDTPTQRSSRGLAASPTCRNCCPASSVKTSTGKVSYQMPPFSTCLGGRER